MPKPRWWFIAIVAIGCGGTDEPDTEATPNEYCERLASRSRSCESGTLDGAACRTALACRQAVYDPPLLAEVYKCALALPCGGTEQPCIDIIAGRSASDATVTKFNDDCARKSTECGGAFACTTEFALFTPAARASYSACLASECAKVKECLDGVHKVTGCAR